MNPPPVPQPKRPLSPRLCVLVNQGAFPGLGTILSGRRIGYAQAALMLAGFFLTMGFMLLYLSCMFGFASNNSWTETTLRDCYRPHLWMLFTGGPATAAAWLWALTSSLQILHDATVDRR